MVLLLFLVLSLAALLSTNTTFITLRSNRRLLLFSTVSPQEPILSPPVSVPQMSTLLWSISFQQKTNRTKMDLDIFDE